MSEESAPAPAGKPDGSVYQQQMKELAERNAAAQKVGRAQRREREDRKIQERFKRDRDTDKGLSTKGTSPRARAERTQPK